MATAREVVQVMEQHALRICMPTSLQIERRAPALLGLAAAAAWWYFDGSIGAHMAKELLGALLGAGALAAGFLTTSLSILLPIASTGTGAKLRKSGYRDILFKYMRSAIWSSLALAAVCVVAFFTLEPEGGPSRPLSLVLVFTAAYSATALVRVAEILMSLFERASEPDDKGG